MIRVGCLEVYYYPRHGTIEAPQWGIVGKVIPSYFKWEGRKEQFSDWGVRLPFFHRAYYLEALEALESLGLRLYAEANDNGLTGRVAVQVKE